MKRSNRLVVLVGLLLAALSFVGIFYLLNQRGPAAGEPAEVTETVLVAAEDIEIGEALTADKVTEQEVPEGAAQTGALRDASQLSGRVALYALPAGSQVTDGLFGAAGGAIDIAGQLRPGEKAIAVQLDPVTGLNFLLQQGDVVDVVLSVEFGGDSGLTASGGGNQASIVRTVKTVLQNKRVLYVSATSIRPPVVEDAEGQPAQPTTVELPGTIVVVIAGTDQEAELIKFAQRDQTEVGSITMTLRGRQDTAEETTTGVTLRQLFDTYGVVVPPALDLPAEAAAPGP